ncbi:hypothetical protein IWX90DRAFT_489205 [Phyllosticta citrichinensis]|uniref:Uncharacterized protein n=1 Tax=Phyllosticta citrichinensis TaxID=1130410 RepID=A0ABR1XLU3_9PEZI
MSLWQNYRAAAPKTKLLVGVGLMAWGGFGLLSSGKTEEALSLVPTEEDKSKLPSIHVVDKQEKQ